MDAIFFQVKRAYYATLNFTRPSLRGFGLTPARFDLIIALLKGGHRATQSMIRRKLGVARSTVSRMLAAMEKAGLVTRERDPRDGRERCVELTAEGWRRFRDARRDLFYSGITALAVDCTLARDKWFTPTLGYSFPIENVPQLDAVGMHCHEQRDNLTDYLFALRTAFGDTAAALFYPDGQPP
jgi:DNA-binding MarR family transcriptional regulator